MMTKGTKSAYTFNNRVKNPDYEKEIRFLPVYGAGQLLRSCLIHDNAEKLPPQVMVKRQPKWITSLNRFDVDTDTGEMIRNGKIQTNEIKQSNNTKIKALDKYCDWYQPLYQAKEVSLLFHTFTRANYASLTMREMIDNVKYHYKEMLDREVRGYIWTAEVSQDLHWHYHLAVAIDRVNFSGKKIPDSMKFEDLWGQRTGVEFVRKNIRHYMSKYFAKDNARVIGTRSYGISRNLK
jgi:hypothetical protein